MVSIRGKVHEAARTKLLYAAFVEFVATSEAQFAGDDSNPLTMWVLVGSNLVTSRHLQTDGEWPRFTRITGQSGHLTAFWQTRRCGSPFDRVNSYPPRRRVLRQGSEGNKRQRQCEDERTHEHLREERCDESER